MSLGAMKDFLEMIDYRDHTEYSLDHHPVVALSTLANRPLWVDPSTLSKPAIGQDLSLFSPQITDIPEILVVHLGTIPAPIDDRPFWSNQPAQFHSDNPTMVRDPFLPDLSQTAAFADGMDQFHPVAVDDTFGFWLDQEMVGQRFVLGQQALQAGTFWQSWKQVPPVASQPAIESPKMHSFEAKEQPNGNDFTGVQVGIFSFLDVTQFIIYDTKEPGNNKFGSQGFVLLLAFLTGKWLKDRTSLFIFQLTRLFSL
jgi:hypothetical protein